MMDRPTSDAENALLDRLEQYDLGDNYTHPADPDDAAPEIVNAHKSANLTHLAIAGFALTVTWAAATTPRYSTLHRHISWLAATGAPTRLPVTLAMLALAAALTARGTRSSVAAGLGMLGVALTPLPAHPAIHAAFGAAFGAALIAYAWEQRARLVAVASAVTYPAALLGAPGGLCQRAAIGVVLAWWASTSPR